MDGEERVLTCGAAEVSSGLVLQKGRTWSPFHNAEFWVSIYFQRRASQECFLHHRNAAAILTVVLNWTAELKKE
jgi:hypothetical protein